MMKRLGSLLAALLLSVAFAKAQAGPSGSSVRLQVLQGGSVVRTWVGGLAVLNCSTGVTCTWNSGTKRLDITVSSTPQVNADWNAGSGAAQILNKPTLAANTTSTAHQFFTAYSATTGAFTKAQPAAGDVSGLATVASTGAYSDLTGKPTIPSLFSDLGGTATDGQLANAYSGVGSCPSNQWVNALVRNTAPTCAQLSFANLSSQIASSQIPSAIVTEAMLNLTDLTTFDVSASRHGFVKKLPNDATKYLDGTGLWSQLAAVATSGSAADLGSGTLNAARLPNPSASSLGGTQSLANSAWTIVQTVAHASPVTITSTGAGNLIVVVTQGGTGTSVSSVTDNAGSPNTYVSAAAKSPGSNGNTEIWYTLSSNSGATTITVNGVTTPNTVVYEVAPGTGTFALDAVNFDASQQSASATPSVPAVTSTLIGDFMAAVMYSTGTVSAVSGGSEFTLDSTASGNGWAHLTSAAQTAASHQVTFATTNSQHNGSIAAFKLSHVFQDGLSVAGIPHSLKIGFGDLYGSAVNSQLPGSGVVTVSPGSQTCTLGSSCTIPLSSINAQTATYQALAADFSSYKTITVASGTFTVTLVASGSQPANGQYVTLVNYGSGVVTIARSGQNINGGTTSLSLPAGSATAPTWATIWSDGTNYFATVYGGSGSVPSTSPGSSGANTIQGANSSTVGMSFKATASGTPDIFQVLNSSGTVGSGCDHTSVHCTIGSNAVGVGTLSVYGGTIDDGGFANNFIVGPSANGVNAYGTSFLLLRGAEYTSSTGAVGAGPVLVRGGNDTANAAEGGSLQLAAGSNSSTSNPPGLVQVIVQKYKGSAATQNALLCMTSTYQTVTDCPLAASNGIFVGVALTTSNPISAVAYGEAIVLSDNTAVVGDFVCMPPVSTGTAGKVHDNGTVDCALGLRVGVVEAITDPIDYGLPIGGRIAVSSTSPLVLIRTN